MFKNSKHIFDNEDTIQKTVGTFNLINGKRTLKNYTFKDSKTEIMIQLSDVIVGLTSKYHSFINNHSEELILSEFEKLNDLQKSNLQLYVKIISKSDKYNPGFFHHITGNDHTVYFIGSLPDSVYSVIPVCPSNPVFFNKSVTT